MLKTDFITSSSASAKLSSIIRTGGTESDNLAIWGALQGQRGRGEVLYTALMEAPDTFAYLGDSNLIQK